MANQIVTLKDDNNNPTFPIAGGMAEDSITTQMLKDGSVTSEKIDFATFDISAGTVSISNKNLVRVGNIVIINIQTNQHQIALQETYGTIPSDYRPPVSIVAPGVVQGTGASCSIAITSSTGVINLQACSDIPSANNRVAFTFVYTLS